MDIENHIKTRIDNIEQVLNSYANPVKKVVLPRFFKTGEGEYGEGDCFLGVMMPHIRQVVKCCSGESLQVIEGLLQRPWHECRMCALLLLVERYRKGNAAVRQAIYEFYLQHTARINNWDLVDLSAPSIVGEHLINHSREILDQLARSSVLWEQRIAVVSTLTLIRQHDYAEILRLAAYFVHLSSMERIHDLMQKAVGWMLREMGKRNQQLLMQFLEEHAAVMPRTMLRYSIEKLAPEDRRMFIMQRKNFK